MFRHEVFHVFPGQSHLFSIWPYASCCLLPQKLVPSHIQDCNRHCTPWHQVKHLHRTVGNMNSKTPGLLFIEIPFLQPLTHTPHLSRCQNPCCQKDVKLFQAKSPRKRASQFWSKATWLQKWTTPTSVAKLVQV